MLFAIIETTIILIGTTVRFTKVGKKKRKGKGNLENTSANSISNSPSMFLMLFSDDSKISDDWLDITSEFRQQQLINLNNFICRNWQTSQPRFIITLLQQSFESTNEYRRRRLLADLIAHVVTCVSSSPNLIEKLKIMIRVRVLNLGEV